MLMTRNDIKEIKEKSIWTNPNVKNNQNNQKLVNDITSKMEKTLQMIAYIKNKQMKEV